VAREIHGVARRLEDVAEDDLVNLLRVDLRFLERALGGDDPEVGRRGVAQRAAVRPEGRARAVDDDDVFHWMAPKRRLRRPHPLSHHACRGRTTHRPPFVD